MPTFVERLALKDVIKFARREYKEKKPSNIRVLRAKKETVFSKGGPIPSIIVKKHQIPPYIVALDYADVFRFYYFSKEGVLLGGENVEKDTKKAKVIQKSTKTELSIP